MRTNKWLRLGIVGGGVVLWQSIACTLLGLEGIAVALAVLASVLREPPAM